MTTESAIVEENEVQTEGAIDQEVVDDDYQIEEPFDEDDDEFKVPIIDDIDDDDGKKAEDIEQPKEKPAEVKEQAKGEDKPVEKQTTIPDELIAKAKKLGVTDDDIAMFDKPDQIERLCSLIEPTAEKPATEVAPEKTEEKPPGKDEVFLDPTVYDPNICKAVNATAKEISGIKTALDNVIQTLQRQGQDNFERSFESMIASLGDEFAGTLGKGDLETIGTDSEHFANRCKVIDEMNAIAAGYAQTGKDVPTGKQLLKRALNSVFGDTIKANAKKEVAAQLDKRSNQIISRPTGKKGKDSMTPEKRAATVVSEKLRQFGAYDDNEVQEDF